MTRYIDADKLKEDILEENSWYLYNEFGSPTQFHELIDKQPTAEAEWIPCETSGMPPEGEAVLVSDGNRIWIDETVAWWGDRSDWIGTAWMPLPKPYKGGAE